LDVADQELVIKEIGMFAMELVVGLWDVKAEWDNVNRPLDSYVSPMLHVHLVKLYTSVFHPGGAGPFPRSYLKVLAS
jgi:hypothetical protein